MDNFEKLNTILDNLNKRFPKGNDPFQIITRLAEEVGELAEQVNHFEGSGVKEKKHGEPDRMKLAKEVQDVIRSALMVAKHYEIETELDESIDIAFKKIDHNKLGSK